MNETGDMMSYSRLIALRDGTPVRIRMARADDRERLVTAFQGLDRRTIYTRYFSFRSGLSEIELARLEAPDLDRYILLVATLGEGAAETIVAGASCVVVDADGPTRSAEVAFTVEEDYQRQGLAGALLATLVELARRRGMRRLEADVLAENAAMLAVFRRCALPMTTSREAGVIHLALELGAPAV